MYRMCDAIREEEKKKEEISEKNMSRTNERFFDTCDRLRESSEFEQREQHQQQQQQQHKTTATKRFSRSSVSPIPPPLIRERKRSLNSDLCARLSRPFAKVA